MKTPVTAAGGDVRAWAGRAGPAPAPQARPSSFPSRGAPERVLEDRARQREHRALPGCAEGKLAVAAGQVQVLQAQRRAHSRDTPIIEAPVTRPARSAPAPSPAPAGPP